MRQLCLLCDTRWCICSPSIRRFRPKSCHSLSTLAQPTRPLDSPRLFPKCPIKMLFMSNSNAVCASKTSSHFHSFGSIPLQSKEVLVLFIILVKCIRLYYWVNNFSPVVYTAFIDILKFAAPANGLLHNRVVFNSVLLFLTAIVIPNTD